MSLSISFLIALGNFYASYYLLGLSSRASSEWITNFAIGSFVIRLGLIGLIFYIISRFKQINIEVAIISFIIFFTIFLSIEIVLLSKQEKKSETI